MGSLANEALAHRVIMDPQFQLSKGQRTSMQGGKQVHAQVEAAMKRAYWDMIRQQTAGGGAWGTARAPVRVAESPLHAGL